ncbi:MAG: hypothetical protein BMS9Abin29_0941 [Gemmatimonadota bacterium]|nr:MAG: hypothetical protein BMS9Abin29_0941 [Gemmatimonadota bacterium]
MARAHSTRSGAVVAQPLRWGRRAVFAFLILTLHGCGGPPAGTPVPAIDAERAAARALATSHVTAPLRVDFEWWLNERSLRVAGKGVARLEPDRARLDMFLHNGASVITIALVDDEIRIPPGQMFDVLPAPPLLWAALGVFRPDDSMTLLGGEALGDDVIRLRYQLDDGSELRYRIEGGRVQQVEIREDGHMVHRVALTLEDGCDHPTEATYRQISAFRELRVQIDSVKTVDTYPAKIWDPRR